jgi:hypothetical protein
MNVHKIKLIRSSLMNFIKTKRGFWKLIKLGMFILKTKDQKKEENVISLMFNL